MAANQLDLIMSQVQRLAESEQLQIIKRVADLLARAEQSLPETTSPGSETNGLSQIKSESVSASKPRLVNLRDFTADRQWLAEHRDDYAGQWVALEGGQLISHGINAKEVHQAAQSAGHLDALLVRVEASDAPSFIL